MKRYPEYKNSQLGWVGKIPKHWEVIKFHYLSQESRRKNEDDIDREMLSLSSYTGIQVKQYEYENTKRSKAESLTYFVVEPNQLVVNPMWQIQRGIGVSYLHGIVSPGYRVYYIDLERLIPQYLHYLMRSDGYIDEYNKHIRGLTTYDRSVRKEDFEDIGVLLPSKQEQIQIANFLDQKTGQIDELLRIKERRIELLQEQRTVLINQAVTKGLDPTVEMKPSGVEWIGEMPKDREVTRLKYICELIVDCEHKTAPTQETGYPLIRTPNISIGHLMLDGVNRVSEATYQEWSRRTIPQSGDLILAREAPVGNVAIIPKDLKVCLGQRTVLIRSDKNKVCSMFLVYLMLGDEIQTRLLGRSTGAIVHHLNMADIRNLELPRLPFLSTQRKIVDFLNHKTKQIDELITTEQRKIELLKEYRQSLISEAVTGKIDVRNEV